MRSQPLHLIAPLLVLLAACGSCAASGDFIDDVKNFGKSLTGESKTGLDMKIGGSGASFGIKHDDGNPLYYLECSAGVDPSGISAGCNRVWKPLFYVCVVGGGLLALFLLSCCCCCCCAPCRKSRAARYFPVMNQSRSVIVVHPTQGYDAPMLRA